MMNEINLNGSSLILRKIKANFLFLVLKGPWSDQGHFFYGRGRLEPAQLRYGGMKYSKRVTAALKVES